MTQGFFVNSADCYGCKSCQVACATEKVLTPGVFIRRVRQINAAAPGGHAFVSMACNHCDEPACVANCPVGAYQKLILVGLSWQIHSPKHGTGMDSFLTASGLAS